MKSTKHIDSFSRVEQRMMLPEKIGKRHLILMRNLDDSVEMVSLPHIPFPSCRNCKGKGITWQNVDNASAISKRQMFDGFIGQNKIELRCNIKSASSEQTPIQGSYTAISFFSPGYGRDNRNALDYAFGSSGKPMISSKTAWHEAVERIYVLAKPQNAFILKSTFKGLDSSSLKIAPCIWERKYCTHDKSGAIIRGSSKGVREKLRWYEGRDLNEEMILIPEHLLFCTSWVNNKKLYLTSSGCAIYSSLWQSRLRAALEIIERDCCLRSWITGYSGHAIFAWESYNTELKTLSQSFKSLGLSAIVRELSDVPGVSAVIALLVSKNGAWPACSIGTSAKSHQPSAVKSALYEALLNHILQKRRGEEYLELPSAFSNPIHTHPIVHNHFYGRQEHLSHLDFWLNDFNTETINDIHHLKNESKASIAKYLLATGKTLFFYSLEPEFLRHKGYFVSRCVSPDIAELTFQVGAFYMPETIGMSSMRKEVFRIPHPFC